MANPTGKGGFQERKHQINRKGRPKSFDAFRALAQQLAQMVAQKDGQDIVVDGHRVTIAEHILRSWMERPDMQRAFIEYAFGKVPDEHKVELDQPPLVVIDK